MKKNNTVAKCIKILELLADFPDGLTLAEIYKKLEMPKSTAYDILCTLYEEEVIYYKDERLKTYVLGCKVYTIGMSYVKSSIIINAASNALSDLAEEYQKTTFICKKVNEKISYVFKKQSKQAKVITPNEGDIGDLHSTAAGKVILAFDPNRLELINNISLQKHTAYTITDRTQLAKELDKVIEQGYAIEHRESRDYVSCIAVPVYNYQNQVAGALCIAGFYEETDTLEKEISKLIEIARIVSIKQGYRCNN